jgi:hypothetical protein
MSKQHDSSFAYWIYVFVVLLGVQFSTPTTADEAGVSFWLPGQYGSFAAVPSTPGWSFESTYYHASAEASRGTSFERGGGIQNGMTSSSDYFMFTPTYAFASPIFGAQAAFGTTLLHGKNSTSCQRRLPGRAEAPCPEYRSPNPKISSDPLRSGGKRMFTTSWFMRPRAYWWEPINRQD